MIDLKNIINSSMKYHYMVYKDKIINYIPTNVKKFPLNIKKDETIILVKLKPLTKKIYEKEKKSPFKITGGPLYAEVYTYKLIDGKVTKQKPKYKNKVYFPKKYLKNKISQHKTFKWMKKDIITIGKSYMRDKLSQQLIAINKITDL